ncbi:hypothetical protein C8J57DRAFT_1538196 [Mycena rebaudengoi]|nr:hypothetical protein C8J57DRAFT_1541651 [Mycena rebaudengoi]KAJ7215650.1 hypothetical protein C8J57DRAFT_1538196 [Mycena rebaudengoi]
MRRGRKPLDPEVQAERRRESRLRYESHVPLDTSKSAVKLHVCACSVTGRPSATLALRSLRRTGAKRDEQQQNIEKDKLAATATNQPQRNAVPRQKGTMKSSKPSKQKGTTKFSEPSKEKGTMKSSKPSKTPQCVPHVDRKQITVLSGRQEDADSDSGDDWIDEHHDFNRAKWDFKHPPKEVFLPCGLPGCSEDACPGCACVCSATNVWIKHWGGHYQSPPRGSIFG